MTKAIINLTVDGRTDMVKTVYRTKTTFCMVYVSVCVGGGGGGGGQRYNTITLLIKAWFYEAGSLT